MPARRFLLITLVLLVLGSVFPVVAQENILRLALPEGDANSLDPQEFNTIAESWTLRNVMEGLVGFDPQSLDVIPGLAESWELSDDGLVYTFHLRSGINFHNGNNLSAEDVVYTLNRLANPPGFINTPTYAASLIVGSIAGYAEVTDGSAETLSGVRAVDDATVEITLNAPNSAFLPALTMIPAVIISRLDGDNPGFEENPIGTGPFMFQEWVRQDHISLTANPNYWGDRPALDGAIYRVIPEKSVVLVEFLAGNLDFAIVPPTDVATIKADPSLEGRVQDQAILSIFWLPLNVTRPPLDNLQVRQAMSIAIDRQAIVDNVLQGQGAVAHGPLPPGLSAYDPAYDPYPYDPDQARQLLADAGFADGIDVEIRTWTDEVENRVLAAIQANWADVGIRATINRTEYTAYINDLTVCNLSIGTSSWTADYADPDNFIIPIPLSDNSPMGEGCGFAQFPQVEELALEALTLPLGQERDDLYRQAERAAVDDAMSIFLYHRGATIAWGANVQGVYLDAYNEVRLSPISFS
jgi:ABC-type transport system substrate-binding protein